MTSPRPTSRFALFEAWIAEAEAREPNDPNAMALATVDADGLPDVRMVLLKGARCRGGFVFYTNTESRQGPRAAGQPEGGAGVPLEEPAPAGARARPGRARSSDAEADAYFATPPARQPHRRLGVSQQSRPLESRFALEKAVAVYAAQYAIGEVPRPPHWSGFRISAGVHRVLAGPAVPPARPRRLPPAIGRRMAWSRSRLYP